MHILKQDLVAMGILEDYHDATIAGFQGPRSVQLLLKNYVKNLASNAKSGTSLLLWGANNQGKTTAAMILAKGFVLNGYDVRCTDLRTMTDLYCSSWSDPRKQENFQTEMKEVGLLVLDDLNKEMGNKATDAVLDQVLRYRTHRKLPYVITTNCNPGEIKTNYGQSIFALLQRKALHVEFKKRGDVSQKLMDKNMRLMQQLGEDDD